MIQILKSRPHLWFQLYWVIYLVWFFALDWTITDLPISSTALWTT